MEGTVSDQTQGRCSIKFGKIEGKQTLTYLLFIDEDLIAIDIRNCLADCLQINSSAIEILKYELRWISKPHRGFYALKHVFL